MNKDIVLALDLSTKNSGWAVFTDGELTAHNVINAGSANLYRRIDKMVGELKVLMDQYKPTRVVIEEVLPEDVRHNNNVFKALMYLQAFVMHLIDSYKIDPELVVASHWRKNCGIKTGAGVQRTSLKPKDIAFVKKYFNIQVGDDEADAICIGYQATHKPVPITDDEVVRDEFGFEFA
jgi:Holliday junction resolvasome RuvABC endonuclease subunit